LRRYLEPRLLQFSLKAFEPLQGPQGRLAGGGGRNRGCQAWITLQELGCGGVGAEPEGLAAGWECQGRLQGRQGQIGGHRSAAQKGQGHQQGPWTQDAGIWTKGRTPGAAAGQGLHADRDMRWHDVADPAAPWLAIGGSQCV
jgi:hypothetical protein